MFNYEVIVDFSDLILIEERAIFVSKKNVEIKHDPTYYIFTEDERRVIHLLEHPVGIHFVRIRKTWEIVR